MGDIADMMLDGTLCQMCGAVIEHDTGGVPGFCSRKCQRDAGALPHKPKQRQLKKVRSSNVALLIHGLCSIDVVNPKDVKTLPMGTAVFCTPHDLRVLADRMQSGCDEAEVLDRLLSLLGVRTPNES